MAASGSTGDGHAAADSWYWNRDERTRAWSQRFMAEVKTPAESSGPWDYYKIVATIPGDTAFTTQKESRCAAWK